MSFHFLKEHLFGGRCGVDIEVVSLGLGPGTWVDLLTGQLNIWK
jgi:hypothetical protein